MSQGPTLTAGALFESVRHRLELSWVAGFAGAERRIDVAASRSRRPSLVGYLNLIHSNRVQILGGEELDYLEALSPRLRSGTVKKIFDAKPSVLVFSRGLAAPPDILARAERLRVPIWSSPKRGHEVLTYLQYHLARALAPSITLHGVFLEVYSIGVLITGESGVGKSELALELVTRGHRLIADDAPEFTMIAPDVLDGTCPELLRDCLEVRGLGVLNIRQMFGDTAIKQNKYLRLIVHLKPLQPGAEEDQFPNRLTGEGTWRRILEVDVPQLTLPVAPGRNLAVLVEAAVRNHVLKSKGMDAAKTFIDRQAHQMRKEAPW